MNRTRSNGASGGSQLGWKGERVLPHEISAGGHYDQTGGEMGHSMTRRAITYARVSGDDAKNTGGLNLQSQMEMCRQYCEERGFVIVAEFAEDDRGASGADFDLPMLRKALEMARAREFDVLVARELDRFARSLAKQLIVEGEFKRAGVTVEYALAQYEETPEGQLTKHVRAIIAEYEREKITERMVRGRWNSVRAGNVLAYGRAPYGYRLADDRHSLLIHEAEAAVVRSVFLWYTQGDNGQGPLTIAGIVRKLSELRVPTLCDTGAYKGRQKRKGYGEWTRGSVARILKSETYAGRWYHGKTSTKDGKPVAAPRERWLGVDVPAIIDRELWKTAQERLAENRRHVRREARHQYLLSRRVTCAKSGHKMKANPACGARLYYNCPATHDRDYVPACDLPGFNASQVDGAVWCWIKSFLTSPETLAKGLQEYQAGKDKENAPLRERLRTIESLLTDNQAQLERLLDLYLAGDFAREMLIERKALLETTISALQRERDSLARQIETRTLTGEQIRGIQDFAAQVAKGLDVIQESFEARRRVIELLDVQATLTIEDGQKVAHVRCALGDDSLLVVPQHLCYNAPTLASCEASDI